MRLLQFTLITFLLFNLYQCRNATEKVNIQALHAQLSKNTLELGDTLVIDIQDDILIQSLSSNFKDDIISKNEKSIRYVFKSVGKKQITISAQSQNASLRSSFIVEVRSPIKPNSINFEIVKTLPHSKNHYTQGLEVYNGIVYQSTGQYGQSAIQKLALEDLSIIAEKKLDAKEFGEGLSRKGDTIYQLTWREGKCYLYNLDLNPIGVKALPIAEGWGIAYNPSKGNLFLSDGSHKIYATNKNLAIQKIQEVYSHNLPLSRINELEWVDGKIVANVYQSEYIYFINPQTGVVESYVDLQSLRPLLKNPTAEVLNGIAYIHKEDLYLVTGKYWDKAFLIRLL